MAENIVQGLFGPTVQQLQQKQYAEQEERADRAALAASQTPGQIMARSYSQMGSAVGNMGAGMMGMVNPQVEQAKRSEGLQSQIDHNSAEGLLKGAQLFNQAGNPQMAARYVQAAQGRKSQDADIAYKKSQSSPFTKINQESFTPESIKRFSETGDRNELRKVQPQGTGGQAKHITTDAAGNVSFFDNQGNLIKRATAAGKPAAEVKPNITTDAAGNVSFFDNQGNLIKRLDGAGKGKPGVPGIGLTKGQEAVDRQFGKDYAEYQAGGGSADVEKQLAQLEQVSIELGLEGNDYTGPFVGLIPVKTRSITNPKAVAAQNRVEEVAQRNLRLVLGAQFTQVEGERLIARAYNPQMTPLENKTRVDALIKQIRIAAETKDNAAKYFEENGTLTGWKGRIPTLYDFEKAIDSAGGSKPTSKSQSMPPANTTESGRVTVGQIKTFNTTTKLWE